MNKLSLLIIISILSTAAVAAKKEVTDAFADTDYVHQFNVLDQKHGTRILIDRYHQTIYKTDDDSHGAHAMLDIMQRDGFTFEITDSELNLSGSEADILIIHGLPNEEIQLENDAIFWKSPITSNELESIVNFVANGGSLFLTLSHFPGGSGARPLLEAFDVKFRDGYAYSDLAPSFTSPDGRCSNFFGMTEEQGLLKKSHPLYSMGEVVEKIDFHCGAAVFRKEQDVIIAYPPGTGNYNKEKDFHEISDYYAAMIGFEFGKGKVVVATDQGMFRNFIFTFDQKEKVYVTLTSPDNDNANLFVNMMRWLSPKIVN